MNSKTILTTGAITCGLTVVIGAFGAHALKPILEANDRVSPFETGVLYQMFHGLGMFVLGVIARLQPLNPPKPENRLPSDNLKWVNRAYWGFLIGVILFSGSLYGLAIWPQLGWLGPVTPIGGVLFVWGWVSMVIATRSK